MAIRPTAASALAVELDGVVAGYTRSLQLPGYRVEPAAAGVGITPIEAVFDLGEPGPLLDWALSLPRGNASLADGAALLLDANFSVRRRVDWTEGYVVELKLPTLDATSKQACSFGLKWQPGTVAYPNASGEKVKAPGKRKKLLCSNFRVRGLPFDGSFVTRAVLPTVSAEVAAEPHGSLRAAKPRYAGVDVGEFLLEFAARSREDVLAWVQKVVADGSVSESEAIDIQIELLDAALANVLATVLLSRCGLLAYEEERIVPGGDATLTVALRLSVGQLDIK